MVGTICHKLICQSVYMPSTVHKLLVHGVEIIEHSDIPIGRLSEDALEARHKEARKQRLNHTRKSLRTNSNKDLLTSLLLTSDPYLASLRRTDSKKITRTISKTILYCVTVPMLMTKISILIKQSQTYQTRTQNKTVSTYLFACIACLEI